MIVMDHVQQPIRAGATPMEVHRKVLAGILEHWPMLSWRGWWYRRDEQHEPADGLQQARQETLDERGLAQFERALRFLETAPRTRSINRRHCTYGWKHVAERWVRTPPAAYQDYYIGEGAFIAACIANGMQIHRRQFGTYTNLSNQAWPMSQGGGQHA